MLKTLNFYTQNIIFLIGTIPDIIRVNHLLSRGKIAEADSITFNKARYWGNLVAKLSKTEVKVMGEEYIPDEGAVVFVCNHLSMFDIPFLSGFISKPKAFIAKIELSRVPILSTWMKLLNCVFIDRGNKKHAYEAISSGSEMLKKGYSMVIFPEGTRSRDGNLLKFKPGSLKLAINAGVPIIPVTVIGTDKILEKGPQKVELIISPPIYDTDYSRLDTPQLAEQLQKTIESNRRQALNTKICV